MSKALFTISTADEDTIKQPQAGGLKRPHNSLFTLGKSLDELRLVIGDLQQESLTHFTTMGKWSMHQLVKYLLYKIGPSKVYLTSWSMTEEPLRTLHQLQLEGLIIEASAILSDRVIERTPKVYDLAVNVFKRLKLAKLHAKVTVIENDEWCVTIVGSANYTKNPRIEAGVIDTCPESGAFHKKWILEQFADGK